MLWTMAAQVMKPRRVYKRWLAVSFLVAMSFLSLHWLSHFGHQHVFTTREHSHLPSIRTWIDPTTIRTYNAKDKILPLFSTHDVTNESMELLLELQHRTEVAETACSAQPNQTTTGGQLLGIFTHDASRVAYCFVPKVACTFWIRVFSFLHNYTGDAGQVTSPWEIPRLKLHSNKYAHGYPWEAMRDKAEDYLRFMFVRDPYSRLWSAYLDKLFLPDFWREIGVPAVRTLRKNATTQAQRCGDDVTFAEFVEFSLNTTEPHYDPIYKRCDPCQFKPSVIGNMETFARDSLFLLRRMNLEWVLKGVDRYEQEEKELASLINYNFQRVNSRSFYGSCVTYTRLAELLWDTFQFNGYIPAEVLYTPPSHFSIENFTAEVLSVYKEYRVRKSELKGQKKEFMKEAFRSLGKDLMDKVEAKYALDMQYFGFKRFRLD